MCDNDVLDRFEDGVAHAERLRRILPAVYNVARINEQPIPSTNAISQEENEDDVVQNNEPIEIVHNKEKNRSELAPNDTSNESIEEQVPTECTLEPENDTSDLKIEQFEEVVMDPDDLYAVDNLFANDDNEIEQFNSTLDDQSFDNNEEDTSSSSVECTFESLNDFRPKVLENGYFIKSDDILSNNIPFKTNVSLFLAIYKSVRFEKYSFPSRQTVTVHSMCNLDAYSKKCCCLLVL